MKTKSILAGALALAMFGACQKEAPVAEAPETQDADVKGYVSVNIKLPSTTATRANDDFNDGIDTEYGVRNVTLVFYDANDNYLWHTGVSTTWTDDLDNDNITSSTNSGAIPVSNSNTAKVLVMLNASGVITETTYSGTGKTFNDFNVALTKPAASISAENNFLMMNAPTYDTDNNVKYLVDVQLEKTDKEAINNAATVQVERAVAKVQVAYKNSDGTTNEDGVYTATDDNAKVTLLGWNVDMTNTSFYPVRKYDTPTLGFGWFDDTPAFVNSGIKTDTRVYYAVDPNYSDADTYTEEAFSKISIATNATKADIQAALAKGNNGYAYCHENTFDINNMQQDQTTRILVAAEYVPTTLANAENKTWYQVGADGAVYTATALETYIKETLDKNGITYTDNATFLPTTPIAGEVTLKYGETDINNLIGKVNCYLNGVCYYPVLIRHFIATENNYTSENDFTATYKAADGKYIAKDLGRYGVVRNNWYNISIKSIAKVGYPTPPDPDNSNDDEIKQFVSTDIEMLSWCLREQEVTLQ